MVRCSGFACGARSDVLRFSLRFRFPYYYTVKTLFILCTLLSEQFEEVGTPN